MNIFVAGTDTSVGKTVVSAILCKKLNWSYWKPIQSGTKPETDSDWIKKNIDFSKVKKEIYRLRNPLSPHVSAAMDGIEINMESILEAEKSLDETIIEGAGGLLVPIHQTFLLIDLIQRMNHPLILVARSGLGTINHTLLSIEAIRKRNISLMGVIMVGDQNTNNRKSIEFYGKTKVLGEVPFFPVLDQQAVNDACKLLNFKEGFDERLEHA